MTLILRLSSPSRIQGYTSWLYPLYPLLSSWMVWWILWVGGNGGVKNSYVKNRDHFITFNRNEIKRCRQIVKDSAPAVLSREVYRLTWLWKMPLGLETVRRRGGDDKAAVVYECASSLHDLWILDERRRGGGQGCGVYECTCTLHDLQNLCVLLRGLAARAPPLP